MGIILLLALLGWDIHDLIYYIGLLTLLSKLWPLIPVVRKKLLGEKRRQLNENNPEKDVVYLYQSIARPNDKQAAHLSSLHPNHTHSNYLVVVFRNNNCSLDMRIQSESGSILQIIQHQVQETQRSYGSRQRQMPFVELNGETFSDSQIIIRKLTEKMQIKAYPDAQTAAIGHSIDRMLDNHTFNLNVHAKLDMLGVLVGSVANANGAPSLLVPIISFIGGKIMRNTLENRVKTSIGVFTDEQYKEFLKNDLLQLQAILGGKKFILGEEPTSVDCTALGQLGVAYYAVPSARTCVHDLLDSDEFASLKEYLVRTKETIYGDKFFDVEARA